MNLINGKYLKYDLLAFCFPWVLVYDGKYNYMVFSLDAAGILKDGKPFRLPFNGDGRLNIVYRSNYESGIMRLCECAAMGGFKRC